MTARKPPALGGPDPYDAFSALPRFPARNALEGRRVASQSALNFYNSIPPAPPTVNLLGGLIGLYDAIPSAPETEEGIGGPTGLYGAIQPPEEIPHRAPALVRRKVFFSFHYQEDIHRTCIVRQSWRFRPGWRPPTHNFYDKSIWEKSKREGVDSLRRLIRKGMAGSSVTCVLGGTWTWFRPFVRYEIAHSLFRRNGLFTVAIHNIPHPQRGSTEAGYNPFDFMGLELREDGRGRVCELVDSEWRSFELMRLPVPWPQWLPKPRTGFIHALSLGAPAYDWSLDRGHENLGRWAQAAAAAAGRR
jgi:hypothetical protein